MPKTLKDEIIEQVILLEAPQQRKVLDFTRALSGPAGMPGCELLRFAGSTGQGDLNAPSEAAPEGCEKVEPGSTP